MNALMQSLEARKLLASVTASVVGGKLTVTGTEGADQIYIEETLTSTADGYVTNVGVYTTYPYSDVQPIAKFDQSKISSVLIDARGGDDYVRFGLYVLSEQTAPVTVLGGNGRDWVEDIRVGNSWKTLIDGGAGDDKLSGGSTLSGGAGNDVIAGTVQENNGEGPAFGSSAHIDGGIGNDTIRGSQNDTITGGDGNDTITNGLIVDAGAGADIVNTYFNSTVRLGADNDKLYVHYTAREYGLSEPSFFFGPTRITAYGDDGNDIIQAIDDGGPLMSNQILKAYGGGGNDTLLGSKAQDALTGDSGNDKLMGGANNDVLNGGTGDDLIYGDDGNDDLFGSDGRDTLYGGNGNNRLFGQAGVDTLHSKNGVVDQLIGTQDGDNVLDRDAFDVLKA
ncbi:MAG TPA: calcium-binding protein [Tepidisphaeraceae bacterium]|jgi:Ca2+-binding RTX toxin-like protein